MKRIQVLLADDHLVVRKGLRAILERQPGIEVVGEAADGREAVTLSDSLAPDVVIMDITMPHLNGIEAASRIKMSLPGIKLLFVTAHPSSAYVRAALEAGGTGYVLKSAVSEELLDAVKSVLAGRIYVSPGLSTEHVGRFEHPAAATSRLSKRERETLQLIAEGRAAEEIARAMNISVKTVAFHRRNIKRKSGLTTASELKKHAIELGLIP